ncbi:FAD-dependent oxidoreductase [Streptomyces adonidis]|uniref:FAD-dependent oxidoreductase n=1 Tax=Streptomyces adonidis TaxID=3231367 RepID=UPI0034DB6546
MREEKVTVVGAGIGGLTLAIALQRQGVDVEVCEQARELDEIGAGIGLFANGTRLLARLGLGPALDAHSCDPTEVIFRDGLGGARIASHVLAEGDWYRTEFGSRYSGIHRKDLQRILVDALEPGTIRLGRRLTGLTEEPGGTAAMHWADDTVSRSDVIVAADGIRSLVRPWVTGTDAVRYSGTSGFRGVVRVADLPSLPDPRAIQYWVGDGAHLLHFPIGPDYEHVTFLAVVESPKQWPDQERWRVPCTTEDALAPFRGWHPAVTEMIGALPHTERWGLFGLGPLPTWSRANVVLLGDSAHGMLPHHGQGANQSVEDAFALAEILTAEDGTPPAARLERYWRLRMPRAQRVQKVSWVTNRWLHIPDGPEVPERDALFRAVGTNLPWVHEYDAQSAAAGEDRTTTPAPATTH